MAAAPQSDPSQQAAPQGGAPSDAPASPEMMQLAAIHQHLSQMAQANPAMSAGLAKAVQGITEAMSASASQPQQQGPSQSPPY
jgi:hypothetical protein